MTVSVFTFVFGPGPLCFVVDSTCMEPPAGTAASFFCPLAAAVDPAPIALPAPLVTVVTLFPPVSFVYQTVTV